MKKWLPNLLTASRGLAGPVIAWLLVVHEARLIAFWLFIAAMFTDLFDGWLAKRLGTMGPFGAWLDPVSDKFLTDSVWIALWSIGWAPTWLAGAVLVRDAAVALVWFVGLQRGWRWSASRAGQVAISLEGVAVPILVFHHNWIGVHWYTVGILMGILTLGLSAASAISYLLVGPQHVTERAMDSSQWSHPQSTRT